MQFPVVISLISYVLTGYLFLGLISGFSRGIEKSRQNSNIPKTKQSQGIPLEIRQSHLNPSILAIRELRKQKKKLSIDWRKDSINTVRKGEGWNGQKQHHCSLYEMPEVLTNHPTSDFSMYLFNTGIGRESFCWAIQLLDANTCNTVTEKVLAARPSCF